MIKRSFFVLTLLAAFSCPQVFAASIDNEAKPGSTLSVDADKQLNFNFSPSVAGQYITETAAGNEQWYALVTYHSGGSLFYGASSDSTVVYKKARATAQEFADAAAPTAPADTSADPPETADDIWAIGDAADDWKK
jgi:hypothetical protein